MGMHAYEGQCALTSERSNGLGLPLPNEMRPVSPFSAPSLGEAREQAISVGPQE